MSKDVVLKLIGSKTVEDFESNLQHDIVLKDFKDEKGNNVLHLAVSEGHAVIVNHLLESHDCKTLIQSRDPQGMMLLI